jgi:predicted TIM-barrel fold metal-dependent hydrolase
MFDFNIHLPCGIEGLDERWCDEGSMGQRELLTCFKHHLPSLKAKIDAGNFMLFNEALSPSEASIFTSAVREEFPRASFTVLGNIHNPEEIERLEKLKQAGIDAVKFHCYFQKLGEDDFPKVLALAKVAVDLGMPILIDTSYGSTEMYRYDNLRLAAFLLEEITTVPVVLLHSGGARILEAFLLADSCPNVYLEASFSLPYYLGSSVERDMAFAYKKIAERVIYGSDFPYVDIDASINMFMAFSKKWGFSDLQVEGFLNTNAKKIFGD